MQALRDRAAGLNRVLFEQLADEFLVPLFACAENFNADEFGMEFLFLHEFASWIPHKGEPSGHAGAEVCSGWTENDHSATGHVLAGVIADTLDHCGCPRVANGEALSGAANRE